MRLIIIDFKALIHSKFKNKYFYSLNLMLYKIFIVFLMYYNFIIKESLSLSI